MIDIERLARAVESAVFTCLMNAVNEPARAEHWWKQADKLEHKFKTEHGRHYDHFITRN